MQTLEGFFNKDLVQYAEETLSIANFNTWREGKPESDFNQVVDFAQPLYLGGADYPYNYRIIDGEIGWEINKQLLKRIK